MRSQCAQSGLQEPASIAIIGASRDTSRIGGGVALDHLQRLGLPGHGLSGQSALCTRAITAFATTFRAFAPQDGPGHVSLLTQSGNVCAIVYATGRQMEVGFHQFINTGNEACLDYADYLDYLADEVQTGAVVGYVEGQVNPLLVRQQGQGAVALDALILLNEP